ncbi:hypothetical protein HDU98_005744, partial [Podochytrium sp. JEL0797]
MLSNKQDKSFILLEEAKNTIPVEGRSKTSKWFKLALGVSLAVNLVAIPTGITILSMSISARK